VALLDGKALDEARRIVARYPGHERSAIMPLLYLAQSLDGWISRDAMREIADLLDLKSAEVEAVASFYTMFRLRPTGTHVVSICTNLACKLRGAEEVYEAAHEAAEMDHGQELSDDDLVTLHEEECLGVCDFAPAVQINFANHDNVTTARMRELIATLRGGEVPKPARGPAFTSFKHASRVLAGLEEVPSA
jgi:NADH-quinone oxidoreductase subunit E